MTKQVLVTGGAGYFGHHSNKLIAFGEESRKLYKAQYGSNLMVESIINMYNEVLRDNG